MERHFQGVPTCAPSPTRNRMRCKAKMKVNRRAGLRLAGLILGIVGVIACLPASFLSCMANFQSDLSPELGYVAFSWLIYCTLLLVSSKWGLVGGVLLIVESSLLAKVLGVDFLFHLPRPSSLDVLFWGLWIFIFLSLLASGVLFIFSWIEGRKHREE